jgi:hypothetical protein
LKEHDQKMETLGPWDGVAHAGPGKRNQAMPRILRNYLISFLIIGLFMLAVYLIDRWADEREARVRAPAAPAVSADAPAPSGSPAPAAAAPH